MDLIEAAIQGDIATVRDALEKGAKVNVKDRYYGFTPLIQASDKGHLEIVKLLIEKGADVNAKNNRGWNALIIASYKGHLEIVKLLIEKGADVNAKDNSRYTALMRASEKGHKKIVDILKSFMVKKKSIIEKPVIKPEKEYVICPNCGSGYNTQMVMQSILIKSPFMADMSSWTTKIICSSCRSEFGVSGSYNKVFGQPRTS